MKSKIPILGLDENYLDWYFRLLTMFGLWNPYYDNGIKKRLYACYGVGMFIVVVLIPSFGEIIHAWKTRKNFSIFVPHITMAIAMTTASSKITTLWYRRADLEMMPDLLNWERQQPCNAKFAIHRDEIVISTIRACKIFSWTFIIMVIWYCSFSAGKDLVFSKRDMDKLSTSPIFLAFSNGTSYWLMVVIDKSALFYIAGSIVCHDILFVVFLLHVGGQLDLLKLRLESCKDDIFDAPDNDLITNDYWLNDLKIECICRSILEESSLDPIVELHTCIEHYQIILRFANLVQSIFNNTLMVQFATSLLLITMAGFRMLGGLELSNNEIIDLVNFLTCALTQLLFYCWLGATVISKSESISLSAYNSKWYDTDSRFKKTLSIVLHRGQIPIVFTAGQIGELSLQTFMNIISKCYSSMALLKQVNE